MKLFGQDIKLPSNFVESFKNLDLCLDKRVSQGSPSKSQIKNVTETLIKQKELIKMDLLKRIDKIDKSIKYRQDLIKKLVA